MATPNMLGYSISSSNQEVANPFIAVGVRGTATYIRPANPQFRCYWIVILSAQDPTKKVKEWIVPGQNHSAVPAGLEAYMSNPDYIYALATYGIGSAQAPQGEFYDFLVKYGASRELQRLEQVNILTFSGSFSSVSYILTGQGGPRGPGKPPPPSYEVGSIYYNTPAIMLMSLESMPNGQPPYGLSDTYTFKTH
jgi:hypothetical protein